MVTGGPEWVGTSIRNLRVSPLGVVTSIDGKVDNLVAVIQYATRDTNLVSPRYFVWFLDWNILPKEFTQPLTWDPKVKLTYLEQFLRTHFETGEGSTIKKLDVTRKVIGVRTG